MNSFINNMYAILKKIARSIIENKLILIIFVISVFVYYYTLLNHRLTVKELSETHNQLIFQKENEFKEVVNKLTNQISYQQKVIEMERNITRRSQDEAIKKISEELKIETKNLREIIKLKYNASNKGETDNVKSDTTQNGSPQYTFNWSDKFLDAKIIANKDKGYIEYSYTDSLRLVGFVNKKGLFGLGKQEYLIDVKFANQNVKMLGMQSVTFNKVPAARYSLGIGIGYYYLPTQNKFTPGIGITLQRNLINIR